MKLIQLILILVASLSTPCARADRVANPGAGAPPPATSLQRSPTDFGEEYACAVAIMGPRVSVGSSYGKLMRRETDNVILMPVTRGHRYGFYLVTANHGAQFYELDPARGAELFSGEDARAWNLKFVDEATGKPFGLAPTVMSGTFTLYDVPEEKMDKPDFADTAYAPEGRVAKNSDAQKDVVTNLVASLQALPKRLVPPLSSTVAFDEKDRDRIKEHVAAVLCTCRSLQGSPEVIDALDAFKKTLSVAPYTTEDCSPREAPKATGVRTF